MIHLIVGHRGVGKTTLLKRLAEFDDFKSTDFIDLDAEIEKSQAQTINEIFNSSDEEKFRELELSTLNKIINSAKKEKHIALGAGFDLEKYLNGLSVQSKSSLRILWIQRATDSLGRVFLDRPNLNIHVSPIEEYMERFNKREAIFKKYSDEQLVIREGDFLGVVSEHDYFFPTTTIGESASRTIFKNDLKNADEFFEKRKNWKFEYYELRTDLLDLKDIKLALTRVPETQVLLSMRKTDGFSELLPEIKKLIANNFKGQVDWDVILGSPKDIPITSLSSHTTQIPSPDLFPELKDKLSHVHLKWAPPVDDYYRLIDGHYWWQQNTNGRSFLPMSSSGRWSWYRRLQKGKFKFNFIKEDRTTSSDQPTLLDWIATPHDSQNFAAVLGSPILHSWSPTFHEKFFYPNGLPFLSIDISEDEFTKDNLQFLKFLGLKFAAITSPLKKLAYEYCDEIDELSKKLKSINTIKFNNDKLVGTNTDINGLQLYKKKIANKTMAVWGQGGMTEAIKYSFPQALFFSARTGFTENKIDWCNNGPEVLVWSAPRKLGISFPNLSWKPKIVIDLNYTDNSMGKEYAKNIGSEYLNGAGLFMMQAQHQQLFWNK